jgi:cytochrome c
MKMWVAAAGLLIASNAIAPAQDLAAGEQSYRKCFPCHDIGEGAKMKMGPPLNGLEGRKAGTIEGYNYTEVNKNSGIVWNDESFATYIRNPMQAMPGTRMAFVGIRNDKEIADLWAYLKQFGPDGKKK